MDQKAAYSYAWKAFLDAGVRPAFGTDYPVERISPFRGLYAAVTRMNEAGTKSYFPQNKITRGQALYAYSAGSGYAEFAERSKGSSCQAMTQTSARGSEVLHGYACGASRDEGMETWVAGQQAYVANMRIGASH